GGLHRARAGAPAATGLAAPAAGAAARSAAAHRVRARAAGERLVGRRGRAPRLLRAGNLARAARLGLRAAGGARRLDAAWLVRLRAPGWPLGWGARGYAWASAGRAMQGGRVQEMLVALGRAQEQEGALCGRL